MCPFAKYKTFSLSILFISKPFRVLWSKYSISISFKNCFITELVNITNLLQYSDLCKFCNSLKSLCVIYFVAI